jgi:hypothetical protein
MSFNIDKVNNTAYRSLVVGNHAFMSSVYRLMEAAD